MPPNLKRKDAEAQSFWNRDNGDTKVLAIFYVAIVFIL